MSLVIVSNLSLFHPNWPFGLFASFMQTLIVAFPFVLATIFLLWRQAVLPIALLALLAFYPFFTFDKFVNPSGRDCINAECLSVVAANLRHSPDAIAGLAKTKAQDADILILSEMPYGITSEDLLSRFPMDSQAQVALLTAPDLQIGSRLAVLSRKPVDEVKLELERFTTSHILPRGIVRFDYITVSGKIIRFVVVHSPPPKGQAAMASRDIYLNAAVQPLSNKSDFIIIGDFNMTAWDSGFVALPGKRAGDPRWSRTWNVHKFWQRITIDHALVGEGVEVVETDVLPDIGSDHFPIHVVIR